MDESNNLIKMIYSIVVSSIIITAVNSCIVILVMLDMSSNLKSLQTAIVQNHVCTVIGNPEEMLQDTLKKRGCIK